MIVQPNLQQRTHQWDYDAQHRTQYRSDNRDTFILQPRPYTIVYLSHTSLFLVVHKCVHVHVLQFHDVGLEVKRSHVLAVKFSTHLNSL